MTEKHRYIDTFDEVMVFCYAIVCDGGCDEAIEVAIMRWRGDEGSEVAMKG